MSELKPRYYTVINTVDNTTVMKVKCIDSTGKKRTPLDAKKIACKKVFSAFPESLVLPYLITIL